MIGWYVHDLADSDSSLHYVNDIICSWSVNFLCWKSWFQVLQRDCDSGYKVAFYWWILRRTRDSPMVIMLLWNRFHWTLAKLHTPCAKKKETVHGRGSGRDEMFWVFYFIFFRAFLVRRTKLEGTTRTAAVERPTHLPPCICLDLKIWKRERVLERNQVSFIDCSVCVCADCCNQRN